MAEYYQQFLNYLREVDEDIKKWNLPVLRNVELKTRVPRRYIVLGICVLIGLLLGFDLGGQLLSTLIGVIYPTYKSRQTLIMSNHESLIQKALHKDGVQGMVQFWLSYWIAFALLSLLDFFAYNILYWVPAFWLVKSVLLVFLYHPKTKGVHFVTEKLLRGAKPPAAPVEEQVANRIAEGAAQFIQETTSHITKKLE